MNEPLISVLMGIYNCANTLDESIQSILDQTYSNWELIMCDDGSEDDTYKVAGKYAIQYPEKIILIRNNRNLGLNQTLNNCLALAQGKYIARQDGDDISLPTRFEKQLSFLENNQDISIVSSAMIYFDDSGDFMTGKVIEYPQTKDFVKGTPFCHAPCMVLKKAYDDVNGYTNSKKLLRVEDYHLWFKMYEVGYKGYNFSEPLYKMRDDQNAVSRRKFIYRLNEMYVKMIGYKMLTLPIGSYIHCFKPVLVGLLPVHLYKRLRKIYFAK